ncbi:GTPase-activating protein [Lithospermum erythrorhizon]|uniref:GTPase-activating protein n=1 Tax=Lithospermum erythrorhizon TaxID=34254 RepID=A0AAV3QXN5_LITER
MLSLFFTSVIGGGGGGGSDVKKAMSKFGEVIGGSHVISAAVGTSHGRVALAFTALAGVALAAAFIYTSRGHLKSPWSRRKRKPALSAEQWRILFTPDGRFPDGGIKFLKKVRSGGVDPSIRAEVWPFLLGVYDLSSSEEERDAIRTEKRKEYEELRRQCRHLLKQNSESYKLNGCDGNKDLSLTGGTGTPQSEDIVSARESLSSEEKSQNVDYSDYNTEATSDGKSEHNQVIDSSVVSGSKPSESDSSKDPEVSNTLPSRETGEESISDVPSKEGSSKAEVQSGLQNTDEKSEPNQIIDSSVVSESKSSDTDSSEDSEVINTLPSGETGEESISDVPPKEGSSNIEIQSDLQNTDASDPNQVIDLSVATESKSADSDSSEDPELSNTFPSGETGEESISDVPSKEGSSKAEVQSGLRNTDEKSEPNHQVIASTVVLESKSSDSDSSEDPEVSNTLPSGETGEESISDVPSKEESSKAEVQSALQNTEDFDTWQRIIRLDAVRANGEWIPYSPCQAKVSSERACQAAEAVGLKDCDHLEPCRIFHASRLVAILEAYALHDPEIGYCQGMSDLLSPIISVMTEDHEAFWCFVGFMRKARHNFRLDEVGIRRQLNTVSKIIRTKDSHLYRHLEKLQAEDCFFVYRMVVVLFRRELTFEQTLCLWEVMWADQAAIRAGIGKSAWSKIREGAPPTDDLLLYAIAASVFQRRKQIIERYDSMDEILRECNSMAGHLDVWRLLDDAHDLVVTLHDKIETS